MNKTKPHGVASDTSQPKELTHVESMTPELELKSGQILSIVLSTGALDSLDATSQMMKKHGLEDIYLPCEAVLREDSSGNLVLELSII